MTFHDTWRSLVTFDDIWVFFILDSNIQTRYWVMIILIAFLYHEYSWHVTNCFREVSLIILLRNNAPNLRHYSQEGRTTIPVWNSWWHIMNILDLTTHPVCNLQDTELIGLDRCKKFKVNLQQNWLECILRYMHINLPIYMVIDIGKNRLQFYTQVWSWRCRCHKDIQFHESDWTRWNRKT